jgi:superfamily II DNA or RNA helicase
MEQHVQRYIKYINEALQKIDIDTATYKEHLHKVFEWYGCIHLSQESGTIVLCWEDVPVDLREEKCMSRDMGIDALDILGKRMIQMKLYHGTISWRALSTFLACHLLFEDHKMMLYRNTESQLCNLIARNIKDEKIEDRTKTDAEFRKECKRIQKLKIKTVPFIEKKDTRPYQQDAKQMIQKAKEEIKNLFVCIPTGCGKTWVILDYHQEHRDEIMLILVPTCVLLVQWNDACKELGMEAYLVDSNHHHDLKQYTNQTIVICVYDSYKNIHEERNRWKRIVVDEAHHIIKPERYMETEDEHNDFSEDEEDEEMEEERPISSTHRICDLHQTNHMIYLSATLDKPEDDSLYYEYKVRQAISDGYLCDYQFIFPIFQQEYTINRYLAEYLIHRQNETHCLIYAPNCKEGKEFVDMLHSIQAGCAGYIDGNTTAAKRNKLFADFESGKIRFLINIRVLVEGYNAPHIRSIFFLHISSSDIFIIQAIGRALRLHPDKIKATIYVPFTHENDIDRIQAFLTQLSTYDERIKQSLVQKKVGGYLSLEHSEVQEQDEEKTDDSVFEFRYNLIVDRMGNSNQLEEMAIKKVLEYKAFYEEHGRKPIRVLRNKTKEQKKNATDEQKYEYSLAIWFNNIKIRNKKNKIYPSVEKILTDLLGESWYQNRDLEECAIETATCYNKFYTEKQRKPTQVLQGKTKEQKENATYEQAYEHRLASWVCDMKKAKTCKRGRKLYPSVEKILIELLGEIWYENRDLETASLKIALEYKTFYEENKRKPSEGLQGKTKENMTDDLKHEHKLVQWFGSMKFAKKTPTRDSMKLFPSVEKILIELLGETWYENVKLNEKNAINRALEYKIFYEEEQRKPSFVLQGKTKEQQENATEEQKHEHTLAVWFSHMRDKKNGKVNNTIFPSVEKILIDLLGENWYNSLEDESFKKALEYKLFYKEKQRKPSEVLSSKTKEQKENATEEQQHEQKLAVWFRGIKIRKHKNIIYPSVEKILIELLGETWYENRDLEAASLKKALEYKLFYEEKQRKPSSILSVRKKENVTDEQKHEHILAEWFGGMKQVKIKPNKDSMKLFPSVEKILIDLLGETWYENRDLEAESLKKALEYKTFYEEKQRKPSLVCLIKTQEQKLEHILATWFGNIKRSKKKKEKDSMKVYPSVEKIIIELLGETWYENDVLEAESLKKAVEYKTFYEEKQRKPLDKFSSKTKEQKENATDEQKHEQKLIQWFGSMKQAKTKPNKDSMKLYESVEKILIELLGETWYENINLEERAIKNAIDYKKFYEEMKQKPSHVLNGKKKEQKENATGEQKHEHKLAQWLGHMKEVKKGKSRMKLYPSVEKILVELLGDTWYY